MQAERDEANAYAPAEIAHKVEKLGVSKARTDALTLTVLAMLAGGYVSLGSMFFAVVMTDSRLGFGVTRMLGGLSFSSALILIVIGGAELFTGNNLLAMAWASKLIDTPAVLRNWLIVYAGNVIGSLATVLLVLWTGVGEAGGGAVGETVVAMARAKAGLSIGEAFARGLLCNALVCVAVWMAMGGRSVADRILAIVFPITAFVTIGFEHSIANWFLLPLGVALADAGGVSLAGVAQNLAVVTLGNIAGGTLLVAGVYWLAYLRRERGR
jgi:formate transporter